MTSISREVQSKVVLDNVDPDCRYNVRVRLIKIRTFSKSLKICTGILEHTDAGNNYLPKFSRVQVLCRKGIISAEHFGELVKIEKEESAQKSSKNSDIYLDFLSKVDYSASQTPVFTSAGAIVLKAVRIIGCTKDTLSLQTIFPKSHRHKIFASWLLDNFHPGSFANILDIAGGKCKLSIHLLHLSLSTVGSTIVDPLAKLEYIEMPQYLERINIVNESKSLETLIELQKRKLRVLPQCFDVGSFSKEYDCEYTAIFGLHPDQATDSIIDYALKHRIPFACIPCCIFKASFPHRSLKSGQKVSTYGGLIQYLREKDTRIRLAELPFEGRNIVLYMRKRDYCVLADTAGNKKLWRDDGWFSAPAPAPVPLRNCCNEIENSGDEHDCDHALDDEE